MRIVLNLIFYVDDLRMTFRFDKIMSAQSFLIKAINNSDYPELINICKNGSNIGAIKVYRRRSKLRIRQSNYLKNIVEQDHRFIKKRVGQG